jgi:hypothetical protein
MRVRNSCTERQLSRESKRRTRRENQISIWLRKATVSRSVDEANAMAFVGEKGRAGTHAGEMAAFAFDAQVLLDATLLCYQAHQRFGLMGIELIGDKDPAGLRIRLEGLSDVSGKVVIACAWGQCWEPEVVRWPRQDWRSNSACHDGDMQMLLARRDQAAWVTRDGAVRVPECRSSHRYLPHACPSRRAPQWPHTPHTPCKSVRPIRQGRRQVG